MLEFGWPLGFKENCVSQSDDKQKKLKNHAGARNFSKEIEKYIKKEVTYGAV